MISRDSKATHSGQAGFTLIELAVALGVTAIVMLGILFLFDFNNKLTRVQSNVADMQQSLRIGQYDMVRMVRMAGRGGLVPAGGLDVLDNVPEDTRIAGEDSPRVLEGTDVLIMRGVFTTPIYQVAFTNPGAYTLTDDEGTPNPLAKDAEGGRIEICGITPSGAAQDLALLGDRISESPESQELILVNPLADSFFVVVRADPTTSGEGTANSCPPDLEGRRTGFILGFTVVRRGVREEPYHYGPLSPRLTDDAELGLSRVAYVGLLEEYRFYVQENHAVSGDEGSDLTPVLCRASFLGDRVVEECDEISDGVLDLQVAVGLDTSNDGTISEDLEDPNEDEWFGNGDDEIVERDITSVPYLDYANLVNNNLKNLRISTLVRTRRPDNTYEAEDLPVIENHAYDLSAVTDRVNGKTARKYRRRMLQTIVNLRNLTT